MLAVAVVGSNISTLGDWWGEYLLASFPRIRSKVRKVLYVPKVK